MENSFRFNLSNYYKDLQTIQKNLSIITRTNNPPKPSHVVPNNINSHTSNTNITRYNKYINNKQYSNKYPQKHKQRQVNKQMKEVYSIYGEVSDSNYYKHKHFNRYNRNGYNNGNGNGNGNSSSNRYRYSAIHAYTYDKDDIHENQQQLSIVYNMDMEINNNTNTNNNRKYQQKIQPQNPITLLHNCLTNQSFNASREMQQPVKQCKGQVMMGWGNVKEDLLMKNQERYQAKRIVLEINGQCDNTDRNIVEYGQEYIQKHFLDKQKQVEHNKHTTTNPKIKQIQKHSNSNLSPSIATTINNPPIYNSQPITEQLLEQLSKRDKVYKIIRNRCEMMMKQNQDYNQKGEDWACQAFLEVWRKYEIYRKFIYRDREKYQDWHC